MAAAPAALPDVVRDLIHSRTGICLSEAKGAAVGLRLIRRLGLDPAGSPRHLARRLAASAAETEAWDQIVDLVTTNTTHFFREREHFDLLGRDILHDRMAATAQGRKRLKVWSAAASEGDEAWSAAMTLAEAQRLGADFDFAILGTDLSARVLGVAARGVYPLARLDAVPGALRRRYLLASDLPEHAQTRRIAPELRAKVRFRTLNLTDPSYPVDRDIDVIFLRNVLIYFSDDIKRRVIAQLAAHLAPGGWLLVGHAESMTVRHPDLRQIRPTVYRKVAP